MRAISLSQKRLNSASSAPSVIIRDSDNIHKQCHTRTSNPPTNRSKTTTLNSKNMTASGRNTRVPSEPHSRTSYNTTADRQTSSSSAKKHTTHQRNDALHQTAKSSILSDYPTATGKQKTHTTISTSKQIKNSPQATRPKTSSSSRRRTHSFISTVNSNSI